MSDHSLQLKPHEVLRPGLIRLADEVARKAAGLPAFRPGKSEDAVHEARLLIKLFRTLAWMARRAVGREAANRVKPHLRAAARCLAESREASVLATTLSRLEREAAERTLQSNYTLAAQAMGRDLTATGDAPARRQLTTTFRHLEQAGVIFRREAKMTERPWPSAVQLKRKAAHSCRKAMKRARATGRAEDHHLWRKKAKRLLLLWRVLESDPGRRARQAIELADQLQKRLGDHHDLVVLEEHLRKNAFAPDGPGPARSVFDAIDRRKSRLEKKAVALGKRLRRQRVARLKT